MRLYIKKTSLVAKTQSEHTKVCRSVHRCEYAWKTYQSETKTSGLLVELIPINLQPGSVYACFPLCYCHTSFSTCHSWFLVCLCWLHSLTVLIFSSPTLWKSVRKLRHGRTMQSALVWVSAAFPNVTIREEV